MIAYGILAAPVVAVVVVAPRSWLTTGFAAVCAAIAVAIGAGSLSSALAATAPMIAFLLVAVALAALAVRAGFARRLAEVLERRAEGRPWVLYLLVCLTTMSTTALVSLDGAVVLLVPVVLELARRGAPLRPLLLAVVAVANAFSLGLPEGNPTNLVVLERMGAGPGAFAARALPAGVAAAVVCAAGVAWLARGADEAAVPAGRPPDTWTGLRAVARLGVQLSALLVLLIPFSRALPTLHARSLWASLAVAVAVATAAALCNNLPVSAAVAAAFAGPAAYAALAGASVGALATEHGSVATLLASDLAGRRAWERRLVPVTAVALIAATALLYASSGA